MASKSQLMPLEQEQEHHVKKLKTILAGWRMALIPLKSVILWEQQWHPCAIVGSVSALYFIIWLMDLNFLTTFAVIGLLINTVDFIVPIISNSISWPNSWTDQKEKTYEEICKSLVVNYYKVVNQFRSFGSMRETSPCMYYVISIGMLCILAWLGSSINNTFLLYILSVVMLLWPGIQHRGIFNTLLSMINMAPKNASLKSD